MNWCEVNSDIPICSAPSQGQVTASLKVSVASVNSPGIPEVAGFCSAATAHSGSRLPPVASDCACWGTQCGALAPVDSLWTADHSVSNVLRRHKRLSAKVFSLAFL